VLSVLAYIAMQDVCGGMCSCFVYVLVGGVAQST
jgi:hypothetical protein